MCFKQSLNVAIISTLISLQNESGALSNHSINIITCVGGFFYVFLCYFFISYMSFSTNLNWNTKQNFY